MGVMPQKQQNIGQLEQMIEHCLEKRLGEFKSAIQNQAFPHTRTQAEQTPCIRTPSRASAP